MLVFHTTCPVDDTGSDTNWIRSEICFNYNEDTLTIIDVINKAAPKQLSRIVYSGSAYTCQGWLTDYQKHFFL
jgi:hypothetical protein